MTWCFSSTLVPQKLKSPPPQETSRLLPHSLDQTLLLISCCSQIVTLPLDVLNEIVVTLEYLATANIQVAHVHMNKPRDSMAVSKQAASIQ